MKVCNKCGADFTVDVQKGHCKIGDPCVDCYSDNAVIVQKKDE